MTSKSIIEYFRCMYQEKIHRRTIFVSKMCYDMQKRLLKLTNNMGNLTPLPPLTI